MFDVTLTVKCDLGVFIDGGNRIFGAQKEPYQFPHWSGLHFIHVQGMGDILFFDLGEKSSPLIRIRKSRGLGRSGAG